MELLVFGHAGVPALIFPTSQGRFFEFEDRGMIASISHKFDAGELQFFCLDSVDAESWYNRNVPPRWRIARQMQYESYVMDEVMGLVREKNRDAHCVTVGASFGGYHAVDMALRHPDVFTGFLSMSGAFDIAGFLHGYYDEDVYFHAPPHYIANMGDPWFLDRYRRNTYVLGTGHDDQCLWQNERLGELLRAKGIPCRLDVWNAWNSHDWPTWKRMMNEYL